MKKDAASAQNGRDSVAANSRPPTGGPTKLLPTSSAAYWWPLGVSRNCGGAVGGGVLAAVGRLQQRRRHDRRQHRLGGVVEQGLGDTQSEGHEVERPDAGRA